MKILHTLVIVSLIVASCAPKYGAHFQKSSSSEGNAVAKTDVIEATPTAAPVAPKANEEPWIEVTASAGNKPANPLIPAIERHNQRIAALEHHNLNSEEKEVEIKKSQKTLKKEIKKELKREIKEAKAKDDQYVLMMILGILIAPLGVGLTYGIGPEFWISLVLFLLFWLPGAIYGGIKVHQFFRG